MNFSKNVFAITAGCVWIFTYAIILLSAEFAVSKCSIPGILNKGASIIQKNLVSFDPREQCFVAMFITTIIFCIVSLLLMALIWKKFIPDTTSRNVETLLPIVIEELPHHIRRGNLEVPQNHISNP